MLKRLLTVAFAIVALAGLAGTSHAQYLYLDANGDGVWSTADRLNANGIATVVDAWINTNHNRDGSLALCDTGDGDLGFWNSYAMNLQAANGTVSFTNFVNQKSTWTIQCVGVGVDFLANSTEMTVCRATPTSEPGGLQRMFTVTITGTAGTPRIQYLALGNLSPNFSSFGTPCSGNDFDNTYKLGSDFFDSDGILAAPATDVAPTVTAPATASGNENTLITFTVSAADPDGPPIASLTAASSPATTGSTFTANASNTSGTFSWTPSFTQSGSYTVTFTASNVLSGSASTAITVNNVDRAPVVTAPLSAVFSPSVPGTVTVTAADPDGEAITSLTEVSTPPTTGSTFTTNASNTSGTFSWMGNPGDYSLRFTASNALSGTAATSLHVSFGDRAPVVTAPATASGNENTLITYTVSASDPDGEAIASLTAASSPATTGSTFTSNAAHTSGTFSWTPTFTQAGTFTVTVTAQNALTGSAATTVTVNNVDRAPVVTAPATASGAENTLITFTLTAIDPDGQAVTSLTRTSNPATTGSTFAVNASNSSATWSWTPNFSQQGTYTVDFTASNTLQGTARTTVTVTNVDRPPTVIAPATASGNENTLISFSVTASDPDGDPLTSLTTASSPPTTGSTFTVNASNNFGGFEWTPSFTQAGSYTATFTVVANGVSATASTAITVNNVDRAPVVTAPANASGTENTLITYTVTAADPDGQAITSLTAASSPATTGSTFTVGAGNTSGTFSWTPTLTQAGTYTVTVTATNALTGTAATTVTVNDAADNAPVVNAPTTASGNENTLITFTVTASDADGNTITSFTHSSSPATTGSTFTTNAGNTSGTFSWTPSFTQAGTYTVTFTASTSAPVASGSDQTVITVNNVDRAPTVTAPVTATIQTGVAGTVTVTAADPDGQAITSLTEASTPSTTGSTFTAGAGNTSGTFSWTPSLAQGGTYTLTFTASNALSGSAATTLLVGPNDRAPVVTAPATASGAENTLITFTITAADPDGQAITSLTRTSNPPTTGSTFAINASNSSATWSWTPNFSNQGTYFVDFTASNALSGSARTTVTVTNVDRPPTVTAPATQTVNEGALLSFLVMANDPDADAVTSLTSASSPATTGSTFTTNASNTQGGFEWTPSFTQAGSYTATFTAVANGVSATASTAITVNNVDRAPVVTAPATQSVTEANLLTFTVTASDPDGPITSLTASSSPATTGSTFTTNASNSSGTFSWTPSNTQAGSYSVTFTASQGVLSSFAITNVTVNNFNRNPTVTAPASQTTSEGVLLTFGVTATDADGDHVTLAAIGAPTGSSFVDNGNNTGTFSWTPGFNQAGSYSVTFRGDDGNGGIGNVTTAITVNNVDRAPVANAGGPYSGITNFPVQFHGSGSSDPDGDALSYMWDFGDGGSSTDQDPVHTYTASGLKPVTLTVSSGSPVLSDTDATTATITDTLPARAFAVGGNTKTSLGAGKPFTCFQVEAVGNSFNNSQVLLPTVRMIYPPGTSNMIFASGAKTGIDGDKDGNGVTEITACFAKEDMRVLFAGLPAGNNTVMIEIKGDIAGGGSFSATLEHTVKSNGGFLAASISPNPLNPRAMLSFTTTKPGAIRVQMFDPQGRLVKTIADEPVAMAGYHDYTIDGRSATGTKLASGVYFVKVWSERDGDEVQRITILK